MKRVRLLLVLIGALSASCFFNGLYFENQANEIKIIEIFSAFGVISGPFLFLASAIMLVFSFFKVSESSDGKLTYDPSNFHWRCLKKFFSVEGSISLCAAFWLTALMTFFSVIISGSILLLSWVIISGHTLGLLQGLKTGLPVLGFVGSFILPIVIASTWPNSGTARKISLFFIFLAFIGWFVAAPFYILLYRENLTMSAAVAKYLWEIVWIVSIAAGTIAGFVLLGLLAQYLSSFAPDSLLGKFFLYIKSNFCPRLYESSTVSK